MKFAPGFRRNGPGRSPFGYWRLVEKFDDIAFKRLGGTGLVSTIADMTPTYLRPDAHTDCLHVCISEMTGTPLQLLGYSLYDALSSPARSVV